jgi:hypothetical protein
MNDAIKAVTERSKSGVRGLLRLYHPQTWREKGLLWSIGLVIATYLIVILALWAYWDREPAIFNVRANALAMAGGDASKLVPGYATTSAFVKVAETLLDKPGGYLSNDISIPGILMDNMPSWEFGVVIELRDTVRALRNDFSRAQTQSIEDRDLMMADAQFHFDNAHWILPATEQEYRKGIDALQRYLRRLASRSGDANFFARADNLNAYLAVVEKRLGDFAQRLSANVPELRINIESTADDQASQAALREVEANNPVLAEIDNTFREVTITNPWLEIDNIFYETRGYVWTLLHVLKAIEIDFRGVLQGKSALLPMRRIIHKLENTQPAVWSPMILNNSGFGMLTNHSLIMASYISRANAAIIDLRILLMQG